MRRHDGLNQEQGRAENTGEQLLKAHNLHFDFPLHSRTLTFERVWGVWQESCSCDSEAVCILTYQRNFPVILFGKRKMDDLWGNFYQFGHRKGFPVDLLPYLCIVPKRCCVADHFSFYLVLLYVSLVFSSLFAFLWQDHYILCFCVCQLSVSWASHSNLQTLISSPIRIG